MTRSTQSVVPQYRDIVRAADVLNSEHQMLLGYVRELVLEEWEVITDLKDWQEATKYIWEQLDAMSNAIGQLETALEDQSPKDALDEQPL